DASGPGQSIFYLLVAFVVLAVPTACMGATLPMLTRYVVRTEAQIGPRVGLLYAMNTVGAVGGTVTAGFLLLPAIGLTETVWVGVAINSVVFLIAAGIARSITPIERTSAEPARTVETPQTAAAMHRFSPIGPTWILPLMLLSGANTFAYEVLWTRLLTHILGGSVAAFAAMLASFLSGIAIGSAIAARFATTRDRAVTGFILAQAAIAATSVAIYELLPLLIPETAGLRGNVLLAIAILLPATLFVGATFPFAVRILARDERDAAPSSARVYAWNTVGAVVGAAIAGFVLIPLLRYEGAIQLAVATNVVLALAASVLILRGHVFPAIAGAILLAIAVLAYHPARPDEILKTSPIAGSRDGEIRYYGVGRSATVVILEEDGYLNLRTNGLPESSANVWGAPPDQRNQRLLSILPVLARPDTRDMLIVGFGAGVALEVVPPSVASIDVIELEPRVIDANRVIGPDRQIDPLNDYRVSVYINDARSALALTARKYDAIVSQPSHPWTAGASHLYTREFMALTREHLNPGGVFLQWISTEFVTESLLRSLCATLLDVYAYARVYQWQPETLLFLGSDEPLDIERTLARTGRPLRDDPQHYLENGVGSVEDLLIALAMDQANIRRFAARARPLTDDLNRLATESVAAMERDETLSFSKLVDLFVPYDPLLQGDSWIHDDFPGDLEFSYISDRLERLGFKKRA
ncbi:MAG: fused MFS/spermidine synthase, partial [Myxococcota bacterium]